jgi:hypothetical protein
MVDSGQKSQTHGANVVTLPTSRVRQFGQALDLGGKRNLARPMHKGHLPLGPAKEKAMKKTSPTLFVVSMLVAALSGCSSDGQLGEEGNVRFSQVVDFQETDDFDSAVAVNKTILIALQHPKGGTLFELEETFPELELNVEGPGLSQNGQTFPLGFAQYSVILEEPGDYRLVAEDRGQELDHLRLRAEPMAGIRLSNEALLTTRGDECTTTETVNPEHITLHPNQSLRVYVVPTDDIGRPLLGLLNLTAHASQGLELDAPLVGHGASANALDIRANGSDLGERVEVVIQELTDDVGFVLNLDASDEDAELECDDDR